MSASADSPAKRARVGDAAPAAASEGAAAKKTRKTRVLLVRHGATELTQEDRFAGSTDVLLSDEGAAQAAALAARLNSVPISAAYCSPMKRTVKTASILVGSRKEPLEVVPVAGLREIDHGVWEGKTRKEVESSHSREYLEWEADPFTFAPPGGESGLQVLDRSLPELRAIVEKHAGETVLIVSHKATIRLLIGAYLGFDLRRYRDNLDMQPCALNIIDFTIDAPIKGRLSLYNDISHYASQCLLEPQSRLSKTWCN